jgi:hypothetical protein
VRIPAIVTICSDASRPSIPIDRDQCEGALLAASEVKAAEVSSIFAHLFGIHASLLYVPVRLARVG